MKTRLSGRWLTAGTAGFVALLCSTLVGHAASGRIYLITSNPGLEAGTNNFGGFLRQLGYTVTVMQDAGANPYEYLDQIAATNATLFGQLVSELTNNYDLIIIHRNYGSGALASTTNEIAIWNNLNVPILLCNAPIARNNRWRWVNTANSGYVLSPKDVTFLDPSHPIVEGLNTDLFVTNNFPVGYGGVFNLDWSLPDGGTNMHAIASANVIYSPLCLAVWDENAGEVRGFYEGSGQTYVRRRVFFEMPEYRNGGDWGEISYNGRLVWANAVAYAMTGIVPPAITIGNFSPGDGSQYNSAATTFSFQATCSQPIPTSGIHVSVNGVNVTSSLSIGGTPTSRTVSYTGLVPNEVYNIHISVSNAVAASQASVQFDTFDPATVQVLYPDWDNVFSGSLNSNAWRLFLQLQSDSPQVVSLTQSNASEAPPAARLKGVFYLPGSMSANRLIPLTDAFGTQMIVRTPADTVTFIPGPMSGVTLLALFLVPVVPLPAPGTLPPRLGQASPYPGQGGVSPLAELDLDLIDGDATVVLAGLKLFFNDADVTGAATVNDTVSGVHLHYTPPNFLAPSQAHSVRVVYADNTAQSYTNQYTFNTVVMPALSPSLALPLSAGISNGFNIRIHMAPGHPDPVFTNTSARAELQLAGLLVGPSGPVTNAITGTTAAAGYTEPNLINYSQDGSSAGQIGGDVVFPYGGSVYPSLMAMEATAWLKLPAGIVTFGVASDDGFKLTGGYDGSLVLGGYEGTRGAQVPSEFPVLVYQPGLYPVRLVYFDGGGLASVEFYTANNPNASSTSGRVLVNGTDDLSEVPVPAYRIVQPTLNIQLQGGQLVITWHGPGFQLMQTPALGGGSWSPVSQTPVVEGVRHTVSLPLPANGNMFYRLQMQP